jgi:hypothetical protein
MLRRLTLAALILLIAVPVAFARRHTPPAGHIKDGVYTDSEYGCSFKIHDNWKPGINKMNDKARIVLTQRKYDIPLDYINVPHYTAVPTLTLIVDSSSMNVYVLLDSLLNDDYKSDLKSEIKDEFEFLSEQEIIPRGRSRWEVGEESGVIWTAQANYMKEVQTSASSLGGKRVRSSYGGVIAAVEHGGVTYVFTMMCEWPFFQNIFAEVDQMLKSFRFADMEEAPADTASAAQETSSPE